jgi:RNA polymerase sigma-70 factor (ECF subfamily)
MPRPRQMRSRAQPKTAPSAEAADIELVCLAQVTPQAFATLYLRYRDPILNYCFYRLGGREEAEDATSTIFIKVLDHLPSFSERGDSFRTWLFRIAHNEIVDRYRHEARHPEVPLLPEMRLRDATSLPEEAAITADRRLRVLHLLAHLPPRERAVLELRAADLNTREIAEVLQISEQSVRTAQCRAVGRLRELLAGVASGEHIDA